MGAEKGGSKSGGFFHLFDWNRKSRKKLFSNGTISPEGTKQGKRSNDSFPSTRFRMIDEEEIVGGSSIKGSSDYSCASSVTDEEGNGTKAPGVVARLMGLDSMPTSGVSEPYCTPFIDRRSLRDNHSLKRSPEICTSSNRFNQERQRAELYFRKPIEFRYQKMPSSPIEKFQIETLPPRSAKSLPISHHKLFSPIKNPGFTSAKNAAQIMEAAAKILETGPQGSSGGKVSSFGSCPIPLKVCDPKESMASSRRTSRLLQLSRTPVECSNDVRFSKGGGQSLNRSWNAEEDIVIFKPSPDSRELNAGSAKGKGRSISLAVQAKVNVQKREGLSTPLKSTIQKEHEHDEVKSNQPFNCQPNGQKNKQQKKSSSSNASGVLRQNNQKQNCQSRGKLASNKSISNQQGRKALSGDASSVKHKGINKTSANTRVGYKKEVLVAAESEREGSTTNKDFPQKKRLIERSFNNDKSSFVNNTFITRHEEHIQPNVVIEERVKRNKDNRDVTDVVSFTFTSPLVKPIDGSQSSSHVVENWDRRNGYWFDAQGEPIAPDAKGKSLLSPGMSAIKGDALSLLLEQKLKELTSGVDTSSDFMRTSSFVPSFFSTEPKSANLDNWAAEHGKLKYSPHKDKAGGIFNSCLSSTNGQVFGMKQKAVEEVESSSSSDARKEQVRNIQNLSPLSIFEANFSIESCRWSESSGSTDGSKTSSSSVQAQNAIAITFSKTTSSVEAEMELSDSASSMFAETSNITDIRIASQFKKEINEIEYIRDILCNGKLTSDDHLRSCFLSHSGTTLDQLVFDKLEIKRNKKAHGKGNIDGRVDRKLMFDCVNECLDAKCSLYFKAGYQAWAKGITVTRNDLASEFCSEISGWKSMGDWMVDELVNKDMSTHLGRWLDFQIEAFEVGVDIEEDILSSLVDEVLADICIRS